MYLFFVCLMLASSCFSVDYTDEFIEDEFVDYQVDKEEEKEEEDEEEESKFSRKKPTTASEPPPKVIALNNPPLPWWQKWAPEIFFGVFLVIYSINFYLGSTENLSIAAAWGTEFNSLFYQHFAKVGVDSMLAKQSQNVYSLRATGRINCIGLQAVLRLKRRQDLVMRTWDYFNNTNDLLEITIAVPQMPPMAFAIIPQKQEKTFRNNNKDLKLFSTSRTREGLPDDFTVLSDSDEVVDQILTPKVLNVLTSEYKDYIEAIHFTDLYNNEKYSKVLSFTYKLPRKNRMSELQRLVMMALYFIDEIPNLVLPHVVHEKLTKARRQTLAAVLKPKQEEKQQEAIQKRQEEKRKQEQLKYEQMTPDQKLKEDQKRAKRELKKKQQKFKVVYS